MLYMIIESFRDGDAAPVYRRFRDQGRLAPTGLTYVGSWVTKDLTRCYQLMACADRALLDDWMARWGRPGGLRSRPGAQFGGSRHGDGRASVIDTFEEQGFIGPVPVLSVSECREFLSAIRETPPQDWHKGHAASSRSSANWARTPAVLEVVSELLGEDVMLWGAIVREQAPKATHPWHSDIEACTPVGRTVSVWIGLEHTSGNSALSIVPYSHRFGISVQQARHERGRGREDVNADDIGRWAGGRDERSHVYRPVMSDGDALFFDGRLWHGSDNLAAERRAARCCAPVLPRPIRRSASRIWTGSTGPFGSSSSRGPRA